MPPKKRAIKTEEQKAEAKEKRADKKNSLERERLLDAKTNRHLRKKGMTPVQKRQLLHMYHPRFQKVSSPYFTLLCGSKTTAKSPQHLAPNSWENHLVEAFSKQIPAVQIITSSPVEFNYGVSSDGYFLVSVIIKVTAANAMQVLRQLSPPIFEFFPISEDSDTFMLIIADKYADFHESGFLDQTVFHAIAPSRFHGEKQFDQNHPEIDTKSKNQISKNRDNKQIENVIAAALYNIARNGVQQSEGHYFGQIFHHDVERGDRPKKESLLKDQSLSQVGMFYQKFLKGSERQKEKKLDRAFQFLASSAAFSKNQLEQIKTALYDQYNNFAIYTEKPIKFANHIGTTQTNENKVISKKNLQLSKDEPIYTKLHEQAVENIMQRRYAESEARQAAQIAKQ